jgi:SPP1 family predicted phage head-tail adaptor
MGKFDLRIRAGQLRQRVTFLRRDPGQDAMGQPSETFAPMFTAWASVDPLTGREYFGAQHYVDQADAEIKLRYEPHSLLRATDRAQVEGDQGGVYDIQAVLAPEQAGRLLRVLAKRIT